MLTVEIKVNGNIVGCLYAHNEGPIPGYNEGGDEYHYSWEYYRVRSKKIITGLCEHGRSDGIEVLVKKILQKICKNKKILEGNLK